MTVYHRPDNRYPFSSRSTKRALAAKIARRSSIRRSCAQTKKRKMSIAKVRLGVVSSGVERVTAPSVVVQVAMGESSGRRDSDSDKVQDA